MIIPHGILQMKIFWQKVIELWLCFVSSTSLVVQDITPGQQSQSMATTCICTARASPEWQLQGKTQHGWRLQQVYIGSSMYRENHVTSRSISIVHWQVNHKLQSFLALSLLSTATVPHAGLWLIPGVIGITLSQIRHTHTTLIHTFFAEKLVDLNVDPSRCKPWHRPA